MSGVVSAQEFRLPDVGEGLVEADLVAWHVSVGDTVAVNDVICEIETAKSVVELPSPYAGEVLEILVQVGETVAVGTPIIRIGDSSAATDMVPPAPRPAVDEQGGESAGGAAPEEKQQTLVGYGPRESSSHRRPRRIPGADSPAAGSGAAGVVPLAKPPVRKLAKDLGVDLATVTPTGPKGDVTADDVQVAVGRHAAPAVPEVPAPVLTGRVTREPIKGLRKAMGQAMTASAFTIPHVTIWTTVDMTETMRRVERMRAEPEYAGVRVSPLLLLSRACIEALGRHPLVNSVWDGAAGEIVLRHYVNLGIAAATPRGLVVPNIKDADLMSLPDLGAAINRLTDVAREGKTQPADQVGGTFTITNVGPFGMEGGTPIINPGESAILCFGAVSRRPWVVEVDGEERLTVRDVCTLTLSFDHRHIDGATGSAFLADVATTLSQRS